MAWHSTDHRVTQCLQRKDIKVSNLPYLLRGRHDENLKDTFHRQSSSDDPARLICYIRSPWLYPLSTAPGLLVVNSVLDPVLNPFKHSCIVQFSIMLYHRGKLVVESQQFSFVQNSLQQETLQLHQCAPNKIWTDSVSLSITVRNLELFYSLAVNKIYVVKLQSACNSDPDNNSKDV